MPGKKGGRGAGTMRAYRGQQSQAPKPAAQPRQLLYPDQQQALNKAGNAIQGIVESAKKTVDIFRPKK